MLPWKSQRWTWKKVRRYKKSEAIGNEQLQGPLSVTSGIALCAEKPPGKGLITIVMRIPSDTNEYLYMFVPCVSVCSCARVSAQACGVDTRACSVSCKYEYYRVVYTSSLQGLHYTLISLREPCRDGLYKWWPYDNTVTLTTRILLRWSSLRIECTINGLIIKDRGRGNTKDIGYISSLQRCNSLSHSKISKSQDFRVHIWAGNCNCT